MNSAKFYRNDIYRGPRGSTSSYFMQNVIQSCSCNRKSKHGTLLGAYSGAPVLRMVSLEEFEIRKYGKTTAQSIREKKELELELEKQNALRISARMTVQLYDCHQPDKNEYPPTHLAWTYTPIVYSSPVWIYTFKRSDGFEYKLKFYFIYPVTETEAISEIQNITIPDGHIITNIEKP